MVWTEGNATPRGGVPRGIESVQESAMISVMTDPARTLFVEDSANGRIRFTRKGVEKYGSRFARVGFDIEAIRTMAEFEQAVDAMMDHELRRLAASIGDDEPELKEALRGLPGFD